MGKFKDLTGNKYGRLTVIERAGKRKSGQILWRCRCSCGNETLVDGSGLKLGKTRSCGCLRREFYDSIRLKKGEAAFKELFKNHRRRALKRGCEWKLTRDDFRELTSQCCFYCGVEPKQDIDANRPYRRRYGHYFYNGLDRVDNSRGYIRGNVVACCGQCNRAKTDMSVEEFRQWVTSVYEHWACREKAMKGIPF